ncbi:hypothetical protein BJ912DRAFT_922959 [Pholiota molesta]|nr:hypothetical protein BJ912DRAFT_922959 [Pholiota molesta]
MHPGPEVWMAEKNEEMRTIEKLYLFRQKIRVVSTKSYFQEVKNQDWVGYNKGQHRLNGQETVKRETEENKRRLNAYLIVTNDEEMDQTTKTERMTVVVHAHPDRRVAGTTCTDRAMRRTTAIATTASYVNGNDGDKMRLVPHGGVGRRRMRAITKGYKKPLRAVRLPQARSYSEGRRDRGMTCYVGKKGVGVVYRPVKWIKNKAEVTRKEIGGVRTKVKGHANAVLLVVKCISCLGRGGGGNDECVIRRGENIEEGGGPKAQLLNS